MILKKNTSRKSKRVMYKNTIILLKANTQLLSNGNIVRIPDEPKKVEKVEEKPKKIKVKKKDEIEG